MSDINELKKTLSKIKDKSFQDIPAELVHRILDIQAEFGRDRSEALKRIKRAIDDHVESINFKDAEV